MIYQDFKNILKIALIFMVISSCKRVDEPIMNQGNPVFYVNANMAGTGEITKEAGNDDYYMFASHFHNSNDREVYKATLKKTDCSTCIDFFEFEFYSNTLGTNQNIDSNILLGDYQYVGTKAQSFYKVSFINESDGLQGANYNWIFPNSMTSTKKNPEIIFTNPGSFSVNLSGMNGNCNDNITKEIYIGDNPPACFSQILYTRYNNDSMTFFAVNDDTSSTFFWDFGDGDNSQQKIANKKYNASSLNKILNIKLVTNNGFCSDSTEYKINTSTQKNTCVSNFRYEIQNIPPTFFSPSVKISYTDKSGKKYSSDIETQPSNSAFKILKIEDYERNEKGENVKKLDIQFTTRLFYSSTDFIDITSQKSVIGISY